MSRRANGEGSVRKRPDGTYEGRIVIDGKRVSVYGSTRKEVVQKLQARREANPQVAVAEDTTVADYLRYWLETSVRPQRRWRTYIDRRGVIEHHLIPALGHIKLQRLSPEQVQSYLNTITTSSAPRSARNIRNVLRRALAQAVVWRRLPYNPATAEMVELPRVDAYEATPFTGEEAQRFLAAVEGHPREVLYRLLLYTGVRLGEGLALQVQDYRRTPPAITIRGTLLWKKGRFEVVEPKSRQSKRSVPLPESLLPLLDRHLEQQQKQFAKNTFLFASDAGTPISPRNLDRQFKQLLKKANLPKRRIHDLRHSAATFMALAGVPARTVADILGHSDITLTLGVYSHSFEEARRDAVNRLSDQLTASENRELG